MYRITDWQPSSFDDVVGQEVIKKKILTTLSAAARTGTNPPHILLLGARGTGKTTIARCIASYLNTELRGPFNAADLSKEKLLRIIFSIREYNIVFIDEIHELKPALQSLLNSVLQDFTFATLIRKNNKMKEIVVEIPPFSLVAATTDPHRLLNSFRSRFLRIYLQDYSKHEITILLKKIMDKFKNEYDDAALELIAYHAQNPRDAISLLKFACDYAITQDAEKLSYDIVVNALRTFQYTQGLDDIHISYMKKLYKYGTLSLKALSSMLNLSENTVTKDIEPVLLEKGFLKITTKGRSLTNRGRRILQKTLGGFGAER